MNTEFINELKKIVKSKGYELWFGTKDSYNGKRVITNREVILEPFTMRLDPIEGKCSIDTIITLWVGIRREIDLKFVNQESGESTDFIDYIINESSELFDLIAGDDKIKVPLNKHKIPVYYFEADKAATVNTQAFAKITFPIQYYRG